MSTRLVDYFCVVGASDYYTPLKAELTTNLKNVNFSPRLLDRYPFQDHKDYPLQSNEIHMFALPQTVQITDICDLPTFFTFTLTGIDAAKTYGSCLKFYEVIEKKERIKMLESLHKQQNGKIKTQTINSNISDLEYIKVFLTPKKTEQGEEIQVGLQPLPRIKATLGTTKNPSKPIYLRLDTSKKFNLTLVDKEAPLYCTKSLCILSHYPLFSIFKSFLTELYRISLTPTSIPIERHICNFVMEVPLPPPGRISVGCQVGSKSLTISRPPLNRLPLCDVPFDILFQYLNVDDIIFLVNCILLEHQIIIHTNHYQILGFFIEAITSLIYPFQWQHVYIPLLPRQCREFINAPVPFIIGTHTSSIQELHIPYEAIVVDLNEKKITSNIKVYLLPQKETKRLKKTIQDIISKYEKLIKLNESHQSLVDLGNSLDIDKDTIVFPKYEIRDTFFKFFVSMFKGYKNYLMRPSNKKVDEPSKVFKHEDFIKDNAYAKEFLTQYLNTQAFQRFLVDVIEENKPYETKFFDESIIEKSNKSKFKLIKDDTPFLKSEEFNISKSIIISPPESKGIKDIIFKYNTFPKLNPNLFQQPKLPEPLVSKDEIYDSKTLNSWKQILTTLNVLSHLNNINKDFKSEETNSEMKEKIVTSISSPYETHKGNGFAGTFLFVESNNTEILETLSKVKIDSMDFCADYKCNYLLSDSEIRAGWSTNSNDYRTTCPKCKYKFVPRFTIKMDRHEENGTKYEYLSYVILIKEITNLMKKDVVADSNLFKNHPVVFWNIILHLRELKIPLNFLLPQVNWNVVVHSINRKKLEDKLGGDQETLRKSLPKLSLNFIEKKSSMISPKMDNQSPKVIDFEERRSSSPHLTPNIFYTPKSNFISPKGSDYQFKIPEPPLPRVLSATTPKPLPETPKHQTSQSMDFSIVFDTEKRINQEKPTIVIEEPKNLPEKSPEKSLEKSPEKKSFLSFLWKK